MSLYLTLWAFKSIIWFENYPGFTPYTVSMMLKWHNLLELVFPIMFLLQNFQAREYHWLCPLHFILLRVQQSIMHLPRTCHLSSSWQRMRLLQISAPAVEQRQIVASPLSLAAYRSGQMDVTPLRSRSFQFYPHGTASLQCSTYVICTLCFSTSFKCAHVRTSRHCVCVCQLGMGGWRGEVGVVFSWCFLQLSCRWGWMSRVASESDASPFLLHSALPPLLQ